MSDNPQQDYEAGMAIYGGMTLPEIIATAISMILSGEIKTSPRGYRKAFATSLRLAVAKSIRQRSERKWKENHAKWKSDYQRRKNNE